MSPAGARLFVALELPGAIREQLAAWARREAAGIDGLRRLDGPGLHVTLCFLGLRPIEEIDPIATACSAALAGARAVPLELADPLWLPPRRPGVLTVAVRDDEGALAAAQSQLSSELRAGGWYEPEPRAFLPHVTVARVGRRVRLRPVELTGPEPARFTGTVVTLFRSLTGPGGARYEGLASTRLTAAG